MPDALLALQRSERFDLRALYETSRLLSTSLDLEFVLNNLLLTAMSKMLVTRGVILLYDPVEAHYRVAAAKGVKDLPEGAHVKAPVVDGTAPLGAESMPEALTGHQLALAVPIQAAHRFIGLIGLGEKATKQPYTSQELEFVASLVHITSAAVHNSLVVDELQQANRDLDSKIQEMNTLFDLSQEFNATIDRGRLAKLLSFSLMGQMTVSKHLFVLRREASEHRVEVVASQGLRTLQLDETLTDRFWGLDELTLLDDLKPGDALHVLREHGLALALPIHHQSETCGVLCLGSKMTGQPYQPSDIDLLTALANLAFVSIQNSYLVEEQIEKERLEEEMRLARQIQQKLLPDTLPTMPGTEVATLALPSREVGGDYLDLVKLDDERLLLAIADVTGKGVPASLLMANLQACLQIVVPMELKLERAVAEINRVICRNTDYDKFITFFCGIYHQSSGQFDYVNAGHNPPMLMRADGTLELLETGGLLLGVMAGMPYERGQVTLHPGDVLALFTDGVTEAMSPDEEEYGEDRLEHLLRRHRAASAEVLMDALRADIKIFTADPETLSDDLTTIVFKLVDPER